MPGGRKPLSGKPKEFLLRVRLTRDEYARCMSRADELGKGTSTLARDLLLADSPPLTGARAKKFAKLAAGQQPTRDKRREKPAK